MGRIKFPWHKQMFLPMTMSQVDNMFGVLETVGEDRVFGASKYLVNQLHHSSLFRLNMKT